MGSPNYYSFQILRRRTNLVTAGESMTIIFVTGNNSYSLNQNGCWETFNWTCPIEYILLNYLSYMSN